MERTMISKTRLWAGAVLLALLALAGCSKDPAEGTAGTGGREGTILSIAEVNYAVSGGRSKSAEYAQGGDRAGAISGVGTPQTRAIVSGGGSTFFTDRDRLGLFLRGEGYPDVDNRIVQLDYPGEGPQKKWNITGDAITLYGSEATVTAYFPYADHTSLSAVELLPGPYDVNTRDVVWQRDKVHSTKPKAMFLEMRHALTRVKIRLKRGKLPAHEVGDVVDGGVIYWVNPNDAKDFRVVAMDQSPVGLAWSATSGYRVGGLAGSGKTIRNGAEVWKYVKSCSEGRLNGESGVYSTDYPASSYCYEKTGPGMPKGTWYLPSYREIKDLSYVSGKVGPVITANGGTAFTTGYYQSAQERTEDDMWIVNVLSYASVDYHAAKTAGRAVRCVRSPLVFDNISDDDSDAGDYLGKGKVSAVTIADGDGVPREERVIYTSGQLDLTAEEPRIIGRSLGAVSDGNVFDPDYLTEEGLVYDLLLLPVDRIGEGRIVLNLDIDDKLLSVPFPVDRIDRWEAGKAYVYDVYVRNGEATVVFGKATVTPWNDGGSIAGSLDPSYPEYGGGDVQDWNDNGWEADGESQIQNQNRYRVGDLYGGGVVYWVNPDDARDFRVVALDNAPSELAWAASGYVLGSGAQDKTARNGADVWKIAKSYSDNKTDGATGDFATDFPAFSYCYEKTDGGVPKGTWYLPSLQELVDLYDARGTVSPMITANGGTAFPAKTFWSATDDSSKSDEAWDLSFYDGWLNNPYPKKTPALIRCVRDK